MNVLLVDAYPTNLQSNPAAVVVLLSNLHLAVVAKLIVLADIEPMVPAEKPVAVVAAAEA